MFSLVTGVASNTICSVSILINPASIANFLFYLSPRTLLLLLFPSSFFPSFRSLPVATTMLTPVPPRHRRAYLERVFLWSYCRALIPSRWLSTLTSRTKTRTDERREQY